MTVHLNEGGRPCRLHDHSIAIAPDSRERPSSAGSDRLEDRRRPHGRRLLRRPPPARPARPRRPTPPAHARGRVLLRDRPGTLGALLGDEVVTAGPGHLGLQAAQPVAHVLERRRHAVRDHRDHLAGRLRELLPRARQGLRQRTTSRGPHGELSQRATASRWTRRACRVCARASGVTHPLNEAVTATRHDSTGGTLGAALRRSRLEHADATPTLR